MLGGKDQVLCGKRYYPCAYYFTTTLKYVEDFYYLENSCAKCCQ